MRTDARRKDSVDQPRSRPDTLSQIRAAGLRLIYERGYEGMGLRLLAAEAGIGQSTLYGHFATKQDLLVDLIVLHMQDLLESVRKSVPNTDDPLKRFRAFVRFHLAYHLRRRREVFICYSELRSLEPANYTRVVALRRDYERVLTEIITQGVAGGVMRRVVPQVASFAVLGLLSGITTWYRADGPLSEAAICEEYTRLALAAVIDPLGVAQSG